MCAQYWTFSVLFFVCPLSIQWVLAIAMTIVREGNVLILTAICNRVAANKDDDSLESIVNSLVIFYHQTFLSVCVAILGTDATNYVCVALDFLCNMYLLYRYKTQSYPIPYLIYIVPRFNCCKYCGQNLPVSEGSNSRQGRAEEERPDPCC